MPQPQPNLVSTGVVARALGVTVNTVKNWIRRGAIQGIQLPSGHYRIPRVELDRLQQTRPMASQAQRRSDAWERYDQWRRKQPAAAIDPSRVLEWNQRMLEIARSHGPMPEASPEDKAERVRAMQEALIVVSK